MSSFAGLPMVRSILVGLDGSPFSVSAIELGVQWAKTLDAMLVGIAVIDEPAICQPQPMPIGGSQFKERRDEALLASARRKAEQLLATFSVKCADAEVSSKVLEDTGTPSERIRLEAQRYDMILLGKQTYYQFEEVEHGDDTLIDVLKATPRPVVAVPEKLGNGKSVVVAYDGSLQAARTLHAFQSTGLERSHDVHVVTIHTDHDEAVRHAERAIDFLSFHQIKAQRHIVGSSSPASAIIEKSRQLDAALVVMGAYGQSAFQEFFFGSVTKTVLKEAQCPLFLYH